MVLGAMMVFEGGVLWLGVFCGEGGIWGLGLVVVEWWRRWWWDLGVAMFVLEGGTNSNQAHLGLPDSSSRRLLLLEEATLLAWASWVASSSPILL